MFQGLCLSFGRGLAGAIAAPQARIKYTSEKSGKQKIRLIIRVDDIGFCHGVNLALEKILNQGIVTSISVIMNTPWLDEAVEILQGHPHVSVGVHTNINSEWREYRWGPVLPYDKVPSLVDKFGKFFGTRRDLMAHQPRPEEVEAEVRAQIDLALKKGLKISYCDNHMGATVSTPEFREIMEKLANEYNLGLTRYFGEVKTNCIYAVPPEEKVEAAIQSIELLGEPGVYLMVLHPGMDTPEMQAMTDLNATGLFEMSKHRQAETDVLCNPRFKATVRDKGVELIGYEELLEEFGVEGMSPPFMD
ncbi:MAG TPA: ChbG/HpnK family deacetylase [Candidatus Sumerlaeota bacterium]|nr:MAG: hypothetical protein BWY12_02261 [candidate division BRC1 bacterium ADurb.Bin183]HOE64339.1 ChbG/HpnK family deacetylase [Candidatus Sumerlaeota bacterium]HRR31309.1 ChbG/HpnK family deacetylase [Candidatus Sumerlaeia bacterium]HON49632.1 ChbG/HpnK family deacetylase [Candidatus Sumerlaeota bacterium]HOR65807.1 ChbG/HpnK family deacetylase [Candidatus Sumerlaeota bacterium]